MKDSTRTLVSRTASLAFLLTLMLVGSLGLAQPTHAMPTYASDVDRSNWMRDVFATRSHFLLGDIVIPGTHDTGTYDINCNSNLEDGAVSAGFLNNETFQDLVLDVYNVSAGCFAAGIARTQDRNIGQQLADGIRFLDFRVNVDNSHFVLTHTLVAGRLDTALAQVASFAAAHPKEIIIIEVGKVPGSQHINAFRQMFDDYLGAYIVPEVPGRRLAHMSVEDVWATGKNVLVVISNNNGSYADSSSLFWNGDSNVDNNWSNTDSTGYLVTNQRSTLDQREADKLVKTSLIMTYKPVTITTETISVPVPVPVPWPPFYIIVWVDEIVTNIEWGNCDALASDPCMSIEDMAEWIEGTSRTYVPQWIDDGLRANIVIVDYYEDTEVVAVAIEENLTRAFGDMKITADWATDLCLDGAGTNPTANGTNVGLWDCDVVTETWTYDYGDRKIHAGWNHGVCLDASGGNVDANRNLQIWDCDHVNETWIYSNVDHQFHSQWGSVDRCLDVAGDRPTTKGATAQTAACSSIDEGWILGATTQIVAQWDHDLCLDAAGNESTTNGTSIEAGSCTAAETESWLHSLSDGRLHAAWDTSVCLDLPGFQPSHPAGGVQLWSNCSQVKETWRYGHTDQRFHAKWADDLCLELGATGASLEYCDSSPTGQSFWMMGADAAQLVSKWSSGDFCLAAQSTGNGGVVATEYCGSGNFDTWVFNPVDGKVHAGWDLDYCLDGAGANRFGQGVTIHLWQCDQVSETWRYDAAGRLQARWAPELCLNLPGDDPTSPGAVTKTGTCSQPQTEEWQYPY